MPQSYITEQSYKLCTCVLTALVTVDQNISKEFYVTRDGSTIEFEMDCEDLALYCKHMGLQLKPNTNE